MRISRSQKEELSENSNGSFSALNFVTVFDSSYAGQALAMITSLHSFAPQATVFALCADSASYVAFRKLGDDRIIPVDLRQSIRSELSGLQQSRTHTELMWTLSSFSFDIVFDHFPEVETVTYVDADIFFKSDPTPILETFEESNSGVLITRHGYSTRLIHLEEKSGEFNVQFIPMKRREGNPVRDRWKAQCKQWCFARHENGLFGDQKYLNEWPELWGSRIMVWPTDAVFQGPWNAEKFRPKDAVTFHFSSLRVLSPSRVQLALESYVIPFSYLFRVYIPYLHKLRDATTQLELAGLKSSPIGKFRAIIPLRKNTVLLF